MPAYQRRLWIETYVVVRNRSRLQSCEFRLTESVTTPTIAKNSSPYLIHAVWHLDAWLVPVRYWPS